MPTAGETIDFKCVEVTQPIGTFYIGAIPCKDVCEIASADIRRVEGRDIEKIIGIQRELNPKRVNELRQYVRNPDATFPTSVILAISSKHAKYNKETRTMRVTRGEDVARIIDGQHRIDGLSDFEGDFELNVTIFVDMDLADQAMTFATINLMQTKVNKSLVYDLYAFQHSRSPQKTGHTIARLLNKEEGSPFQGRIKILGKALGQSEYEFITQATFVEELMRYISKNPMEDRRRVMESEDLLPATGADVNRLIFRDLFIANKDAKIVDIVWNYFEAVAERWDAAWNSAEQGAILNRTQGFIALMRLLGPVYRDSGKAGSLSKDAVLSILKRIKLRSSDITVARYAPGTGGQSQLFSDLLEQSGLEG